MKEYYFYLDSTPTHSYMKWLYKYPQTASPYTDLIETNRNRARQEFEYELLDTGVFDDDRYFDVFAEYAKESPEDILIRITVANRGPSRRRSIVLPTLWFRNTWRWWPDSGKHRLAEAKGQNGISIVAISHQQLGERWLYCDGSPELLFTENETNNERLYAKPNPSPYVKDGFHAFVVHGKKDAVNPAQFGTKAAARYQFKVDAGDSVVFDCVSPTRRRSRWSTRSSDSTRRSKPGSDEADEFYRSITPPSANEDAASVDAPGLCRDALEQAVPIFSRLTHGSRSTG